MDMHSDRSSDGHFNPDHIEYHDHHTASPVAIESSFSWRQMNVHHVSFCNSQLITLWNISRLSGLTIILCTFFVYLCLSVYEKLKSWVWSGVEKIKRRIQNRFAFFRSGGTLFCYWSTFRYLRNTILNQNRNRNQIVIQASVDTGLVYDQNYDYDLFCGCSIYKQIFHLYFCNT